ncbi:MAG: peptidoglycan-binding protein [Pseudomonadota bacterium]
MFFRCLAAVWLAIAISNPAYAGPEEPIFETATVIYKTAEDQPQDIKIRTYQSVRSILDKIVEDYPSSDLAVQIILKEKIGELDVAKLDEILAQHDKPAETAQTQATPKAVATEPAEQEAAAQTENIQVLELSKPAESAAEKPAEIIAAKPADQPADKPFVQVETPQTQNTQNQILPIGTEATERDIGLDKKAIRDLQARLLVVGHDPNGVDGAIGRGTRAAIRQWQSTRSVEPTGYMNAPQLAALKQQSQPALDDWLRDEDNAKKYDPPAPIALRPSNVSGTWRYTTTCGSKSKFGKARITGTMSMKHAGGRNYTGQLVNSQGLRARLKATLRGRRVAGIANFGLLLGRVQLDARVDDYAFILRGRDSNGCSFYARKT